MRPSLPTVLAVLLAGCFKPAPPPPPPPSLTQALAAAEEAVNGQGDLTSTCEKLSFELNAHAQRPLPVMMKSDLHGLMREVAAFGAVNDDPMRQRPLPVGQWKELRARLDRVLAGNNPTEGPRYQIDMPEAVRSAMERVDAALAQADVDGAVQAMGRLQGPLSEWVGKLPGMRAGRINEVVENDLMRASMTPAKDRSLAEVKATWALIREKIAPAAQ